MMINKPLGRGLALGRKKAPLESKEGFYVVLNRLARGLCCLQRHPSTLLEGIASCNGGTPL